MYRYKKVYRYRYVYRYKFVHRYRKNKAQGYWVATFPAK